MTIIQATDRFPAGAANLPASPRKRPPRVRSSVIDGRSGPSLHINVSAGQTPFFATIVDINSGEVGPRPTGQPVRSTGTDRGDSAPWQRQRRTGSSPARPTMYRDYPISPTLFRWESQNATSIASPTGQRYLTGSSTVLTTAATSASVRSPSPGSSSTRCRQRSSRPRPLPTCSSGWARRLPTATRTRLLSKSRRAGARETSWVCSGRVCRSRRWA